MLTVFLSYSEKDQPLIGQLVVQLESRLKISIWRYQKNMIGGQLWPKKLGEAIADQDVFLLAWSKNAAASSEVEKEWPLALAHKKTVVPCLLDNTLLPPSLRATHAIPITDLPSLVAALTEAGVTEDAGRRAEVVSKLDRITTTEPQGVLQATETLFDQRNLTVQGNVCQAGAIFTSTPSTPGRANRLVSPPQFPQRPEHFFGRDKWVNEIVADIRSADTDSDSARLVQVIGGAGGLGKTAVAIEVAHKLSKDFPDGQFFIYFHTHSENPISTEQARNNLLLEYYQDWKPHPTDEAINWQDYYDLFSSDSSVGISRSRRVLLILDDCKDERQLMKMRPLSRCPIIVTARTTFTPGIPREILKLDPVEAVRLLHKVYGGDLAVPGVPDAPEQLAKLCGYFPIALKAAAGYLKRTKRKMYAILDYIKIVQTSPLDAFPEENPDENPFSVLEYSISRLSKGNRAALCALSIMTSDFDRDTARKVGNCTFKTIDLFVSSYLIEVDRDSERLAWHDLIHTLVETKRQARVERAAWKNYIKHFSDLAKKWSAPFIGGRAGPGDYADCYKRFDKEISHIEAVMRYLLKDEQLHRERCELSDALHPRLHVRLQHDFLVQWYRKVLESARNEGKPDAQAYACLGLGDVAYRYSDSASAIEHYRKALELSCAAQNRNGEVYALLGLANVADGQKIYPSARNYWETALGISKKTDYCLATVNALMGLGGVACLEKDYGRARSHYHEALEISCDTSNRSGEAAAHSRLGDLDFIERQYDDARDHYHTALRIGREENYSHSERYALMGLGQLSRKDGHMDTARKHYKAALDISQKVGNKELSESINTILQELG